ncbi:MAG: ATP-binding protein [Clostridia bacterium]|nr:ATP-binding protein [Clostridia bacterium]
MRWDGFVGNESAKAQLGAAVDSGRLPHALLIEGPRGSGKRTLARLFAKAAVCTAQGQIPCGVCAQCRKADTGHPDITELTGDGSAKSLSVAVIRELREQTAVVPNEATHKVAILADADCMNVQAQNALLKILEEPPPYMLFVLTVQSRTQLLTTVQSRCVCVSLLGVSEQEALSVLSPRFPSLTTEDLAMRIRLFSGCIGAVADSVEEDSFAGTVERIRRIGEALTAVNELELMRATAPLEKDKPLTDAVLGGLRLVLRDALALAAGGQVTVSVAPAEAKRLADSFTQRRLHETLAVLDELIVSRKRNMNQTLLITLLCARLRAATGR